MGHTRIGVQAFKFLSVDHGRQHGGVEFFVYR